METEKTESENEYVLTWKAVSRWLVMLLPQVHKYLNLSLFISSPKDQQFHTKSECKISRLIMLSEPLGIPEHK